MNTLSMKQTGFTLTELMVVIVILCCLATWVPMAWLTPDKPKDLKALEHLRGHAYMHQAYFSMFRNYPIFNPGGTGDDDAYARVVLSKNPALSTRVSRSSGVNGGSVTSSNAHSVPITENMNGNLNQLSLSRTSGSLVPIIAPNGGDNNAADWFGNPSTGFFEYCQKNSPIGSSLNLADEDAAGRENLLNCELDGMPDDTLWSKSVAVGNGEPPMFNPINGNTVMIPHRCIGLIAPSGTIYLIHIAGGETLSTSHIPGSFTRKLPLSDRRGLLPIALQSCEDSNREIGQDNPNLVGTPVLPGW